MPILHHEEQVSTATEPAQHPAWCAMPDLHTTDECASAIVLFSPDWPGIWVSRTEHGTRLVLDVPELASLTPQSVDALIGVLVAARPMLDGQS